MKLSVLLILLLTPAVAMAFGSTWSFGPWTTGESLVDPGQDQIPFWDDSLGRMQWTDMSNATVNWVTLPASPTDSGSIGDIFGNATHLYYCYAANSWRRIASSSWTPAENIMLFENGDTMIYENGDTMLFED